MKYADVKPGERFHDAATRDDYVKVDRRRARCDSIGSILYGQLLKFNPDEEITSHGLQQEEAGCVGAGSPA